MNVLALKPGHDGTAALLQGGRLTFSLEAQNDSFERHADLTPQLLLEALTLVDDVPDIMAIGGWYKIVPGELGSIAAGYHGLGAGDLIEARLLGRKLSLYTSSHERSHIVGGIAMSPFHPHSDLAVLVWEGQIGSFYRWRGANQPIDSFPVLDQPGARYAALFAIAEPAFPDHGRFPDAAFAGKLMALSGLADAEAPSEDSRNVVDSLLTRKALYPFPKGQYRRADLYNCGVDHPEVARSARYLSDQLFTIYLDAARKVLPEGMPLVISGGCGLNCEWNTRWRTCGHFSDVFVPPCADDSGSAIGTAADAAMVAGGDCRIDWDVYAGAEFVADVSPSQYGWEHRELDVSALCGEIERGAVVAWIQGRCEIGPRALGHRSLLASAQDAAMHETLNRIKERESYRPIAPVCLEDDLGTWFDDATPDPYMLFFRRVRRPDVIPAVTHVDGTARVQSIDAVSGGRLFDLLLRCRQATGVGVLCNTSLNFKGRGFINRTTDLLQFCGQAQINQIVIDGSWWTHTAGQ